MAFPTNEQLVAHLEPLAAKHHVDIEQVKTTKAGKKSQVIVVVDADTRPDLDLLEALSNEASELFDQLEDAGQLNFGAGYTLEFTTLGVGSVLEKPRHFRRNQTRLLGYHLGGKQQTARIGALSEDETRIILIQREKKDLLLLNLPLAKLERPVVEIEFAEAPDDELQAAQLTFAVAASQAVAEEDEG